MWRRLPPSDAPSSQEGARATMKRLSGVLIIAGVLILGLTAPAAAGSATDAALGLGAFAVFNQIASGTGVFGSELFGLSLVTLKHSLTAGVRSAWDNAPWRAITASGRSEEHTSELQSLRHLVCRLL